PLIAGSLFGGILPFGGLGVDTLCNVARLAAERLHDQAGIGVKLRIFMDVPDFANRRSHLSQVIELSVGGDFTRDDHKIPFGESFARHATLRILIQASIKDVIRNCIADFVWMPFGHRFGGKDVTTRHKRGKRLTRLSLSEVRERKQKTMKLTNHD